MSRSNVCQVTVNLVKNQVLTFLGLNEKKKKNDYVAFYIKSECKGQGQMLRSKVEVKGQCPGQMVAR